MITDITERFLEVCKWLIDNNKVQDQKALAGELSVSTSMMTELVKKRSNVGVLPLQNIVIKYSISAEWLLTGEGEMLKGKSEQVEPVSAASSASTAELRQIIDVFSAQLSEKDSQIASLLAILARK